MDKKWWHSAVVYQVYPRSFCDSDGDGVGDLPGVIEKLDYLAKLGVDAIWLSPVFKSPNDDNGYDISDYCDIMDEFGTMADMEKLISEAGKRGIKIIMDLVANHTSDEHPWFIESRGSKDNPYRDYYIWRDEPNGLRSVFSGSAWEFDPATGQYYFHMFSKRQPDLNWANPKVRQEIWRIMNFWIAKGIGGFRMDVIDLVGKEPDRLITGNGPKLHEYIREMNRNTFGALDLLTVGECGSAGLADAEKFSNPDGSELSMIFQFEHMCIEFPIGGEKWDAGKFELKELKRVFDKWQTGMNGWNSLYWDNHDQPRIVSRFGDDGKYRVESAKMLATLLHGMKGTPYVYQGEELGMTNVRLPDISYYRDIEIINMYNERRTLGYEDSAIMEGVYAYGRDNARTPMQWSAAANAGFTTGEPWIAVNPNYPLINAEAQVEDPDSVFSHYKKLIQLRKEREVLVYGDFRMLLPDDGQLFAYERSLNGETVCVLCSFADEPVRLPFEIGEIILSNYSAAPQVPKASATSAAAPQVPKASATSAAAPQVPKAPATSAAAPQVPKASAASAAAPQVPEASAASAEAPEGWLRPYEGIIFAKQ